MKAQLPYGKESIEVTIRQRAREGNPSKVRSGFAR